MKYSEITIRTTTQAADIVASYFFELNSAGVSISDKNDLQELVKSGIIWDYVEDSIEDLFDDEYVLVRGFVQKKTLKSALAYLQEQLLSLTENSSGIMQIGSLEISVQDVDSTDFAKAWKKHFQPVTIDGLTIVPKWLKKTHHGGKHTVLIDPGMAFGTGEHQTTRLCISLMQQFDMTDLTVADIGCGSGILGLCALKLGARHCHMSDFDASAIAACQSNARLNKLEGYITATQANLLEKADFCAQAVFINIVAETLTELAPQLYKIIAPGAFVVLSGIIESRLKKVMQVYKENGFSLIDSKNDGEWYGLLYRFES